MTMLKELDYTLGQETWLIGREKMSFMLPKTDRFLRIWRRIVRMGCRNYCSPEGLRIGVILTAKEIILTWIESVIRMVCRTSRPVALIYVVGMGISRGRGWSRASATVNLHGAKLTSWCVKLARRKLKNMSAGVLMILDCENYYRLNTTVNMHGLTIPCFTF